MPSVDPKKYGVPFAGTPLWLLDSDASDRAIRLFLALNRYAGVKGTCNPGRKRLADDMHCSVDKVDQAKDELIAAGAIDSVTTWKAPGVRGTNEYILHFDGPEGGRQGSDTGSRRESATGDGKESATGSRQVAAGSRSNLKQIQSEAEEEILTSSSSLAGAPQTGPAKSGSAKPRKVSAEEIWERIRRPTWEPRLTVEELRAAFRLAFKYAGFPEPITAAEHGRWGKALKDLMDSTTTPREFYLAAMVAKEQWNGAAASHTPMAIVANLAQLLEDGTGDESRVRAEHEFNWTAQGVDTWGQWLASVGEYTLPATVEYTTAEFDPLPHEIAG